MATKLFSVTQTQNKVLSAILPVLVLLCILGQQASSHLTKSTRFLLISFDGFRWDYLNKFQKHTPNFHTMVKNGVYARNGLKSVFETITIPNHWTLVTGLYTESHGLSSNIMYDPVLKKDYLPIWLNGSHVDNYLFFKSAGEPIWVTNQIQNNKARSGCFMWFGAENPVKSVRPTLHVDYDDNIPFKERIDTVVKWFTQEHLINLGLLYFPEPDLTAHATGLDSKEIKETISRVDKTVGYLFEKLNEEHLLDNMNIVITSDHGFANTPKSKLIRMDDIIPPQWYEKIFSPSPLFSVMPKPGMEHQIYNKLKEAADKPNSHFQVFKKEDIPERFYYKHSPRVPPVIAMADLEYSFLVNQTVDQYIHYYATHGYDGDYQEMNPFFVAMGPSFKKGFSVDSFDIVDVYPLMCRLLHLNPAPNNGSMHIVSSLLVDHETTMWTFVTYIIVLIVISSVGGVILVYACRQRNCLKRKVIHMQSSAQVRYSAPGKDTLRPRFAFLNEDERDTADEDENKNQEV